MLLIVLTLVHVVVCLFLVIVVLLQSGKSADIAGAFGGGMGSQTAFGPRGAATLLSKATTTAAIIFMITALSLSILSSRRGATGNSVLGSESTKAAPSKTAATPATSGGASQNAQDAPKPNPPKK